MSDELIRLVKNARASWKQGHAIVVARVNAALKKLKLKVRVQTRRQRIPKCRLRDTRRQLFNALSGLRPHFDLPLDSELLLWRISDGAYLGRWGDNIESELEYGLQQWLQSPPDWNEEQWSRLVVAAIERHEAEWLGEFDRMEAELRQGKSSVGPTDKESQSKIPPGRRTVPMTYRRAAKLMGKGDSRDAAEWLSSCVRDGTIKCDHHSRQMHVFDKTDFPN